MRKLGGRRRNERSGLTVSLSLMRKTWPYIDVVEEESPKPRGTRKLPSLLDIQTYGAGLKQEHTQGPEESCGSTSQPVLNVSRDANVGGESSGTEGTETSFAGEEIKPDAGGE
jgi:hypothetical protein